MRYEKEKPPLTGEEHITLLESRGLIIEDKERALRYLKTVGYYRLTGYMFHLQSRDGSHTFIDNVTFGNIISHYQFDKQLRGLTLEYLERIEVAFRALLTDTFSVVHGFFWYENEELYSNKDACHKAIQEVSSRFKDQNELFLRKFAAKYENSLPPSNMAMEVLTFGNLSKVYEALSNNTEKQSIAGDFNLVSSHLSSWMRYLTIIRNICAHHTRLWNRRTTANNFQVPSRKGRGFVGSVPETFNRTYYGTAAVIDRLLFSFNPQNRFIEKLVNLLDEYPEAEPWRMGFPVDWRQNAVWLNK